MRIAVATEAGSVSEHFGHAPEFLFFETTEADISSPVSVPNPGHELVSLPRWLAKQGANCLITGGIGQGAVDVLTELDVAVVVGAHGAAADAVRSYLGGDLKPSLTGSHASGKHGHAGHCSEDGHQAGCGCGSDHKGHGCHQ